MEFQVGEETATVNARMVYCLRLGQSGVKWRQGLSFIDMAYGDAQLVRDLVMQLQREELSRRSEMRPRGRRDRRGRAGLGLLFSMRSTEKTQMEFPPGGSTL